MISICANIVLYVSKKVIQKLPQYQFLNLLFRIHNTQSCFCILSVNRKRYPTLVYSIPVIHLASTGTLLSELSCSHSHQSIHRCNPELHPRFFRSTLEIRNFFECVHGDHPDICIQKSQQQWDYLLPMYMHNSPFSHLRKKKTTEQILFGGFGRGTRT